MDFELFWISVHSFLFLHILYSWGHLVVFIPLTLFFFSVKCGTHANMRWTHSFEHKHIGRACAFSEVLLVQTDAPLHPFFGPECCLLSHFFFCWIKAWCVVYHVIPAGDVYWLWKETLCFIEVWTILRGWREELCILPASCDHDHTLPRPTADGDQRRRHVVSNPAQPSCILLHGMVRKKHKISCII